MEDFILNQLLHKSISTTTVQDWDRLNAKKQSALDKQVDGDHYKGFVIQPAEFCYKNNIPYLEATAIKYLCRWRLKGGVSDLNKAIHFIELLKEFHNAPNT